MIIPMKRVTLLCLKDNRESVLDSLAGLGVMQLDYAQTPDSEILHAKQRELHMAEHAFTLLQADSGKCPKQASVALSGADAVKEVLALEEELIRMAKHSNELFQIKEQLLPWGNFDPKSLKALQSKGLFPYLCTIRKTDLVQIKDSLPEGSTLVEISADKLHVYALIVTPSETDGEGICAVTLPETTLKEITEEQETLSERKKVIQQRMTELKAALPSIKKHVEQLSEGCEFVAAYDGMADKDKISWIFGYVPETKVEQLQTLAKESGFALLLEDPADDDEKVPTYIEKPKFQNIMDPLFDFIGITPGYRENDVNLFFLLFFPIFFGMIIGDAAYGTLFLILGITFKIILRKNESAKLPLNLFIMLSCASFIWGWLNGAWAGIPNEVLPYWMQGLDFLTHPNESQCAYAFAKWTGLINDSMSYSERYNIVDEKFASQFQQFICFAIACVHLPAARLFRFFDDIRGDWRAVGHLGWAFILVANGILAVNLIVYTSFLAANPAIALAMYWLYGVGLFLVSITTVAADIINLPSSVISSFVDVLSYIRLFAVGLAGSYISQKFDEMGGMVLNSLPDMLKVLGMVLLFIVALLGNVLNIGLGFLSVLVHAVRLNTLEFSNHMGMQWSGLRFNPFKKKTEIKDIKE